MCTLNWQQFEDSLCIAFNRDESPFRPTALLPDIHRDSGVRFIMPKDPVGQGSWIAANEFGLVICLLNDYQGNLKPDNGQLVSRGQIVRQLASLKTLEEIIDWWQNYDFAQVQPFQLCVLSMSFQPIWLSYNGMEKQQNKLPNSVFSSGHPQAQEVYKRRTRHVRHFEIKTKQDLIDLHRSHDEEHHIDGAFSICMHREIAHTQSLTVIEITQNKVDWQYWDGQPCQTDHVYEGTLNLKV